MQKEQIKTIRIFLASSNELKQDRIAIESLISEKNTQWSKQGKPQILLELWEYQTEAMPPTRSQDEYNKIIKEVDIFVMLFWTKVGMYTHEEFGLAKRLCMDTQKPLIFVYQKKAEVIEESVSLFVGELMTKGKEYFCGEYEHIDTLKLKLSTELERYCQEYIGSLRTSQITNIQNAEKIYNIDKIDNANFS